MNKTASFFKTQKYYVHIWFINHVHHPFRDCDPKLLDIFTAKPEEPKASGRLAQMGIRTKGPKD